jgi:hypothetical protein
MYTHPEISLIIAAQRNREFQAKAEASRLVAEARAARRSDRARTPRLRWLPRRAFARRPAVAYSSPLNA